MGEIFGRPPGDKTSIGSYLDKPGNLITGESFTGVYRDYYKLLLESVKKLFPAMSAAEESECFAGGRGQGREGAGARHQCAPEYGSTDCHLGSS